MPSLTPEQKPRLLRVLLIGGLLTALLGIYLAYFATGGRGIPCPLLLLAGWKCPACGMTRAASALLEGELAAAWEYNALWPLYIGYILWVAGGNAVAYVRRGKLPVLPRPTWIHGAVLAVVVGYGVLRNIL